MWWRLYTGGVVVVSDVSGCRVPRRLLAPRGERCSVEALCQDVEGKELAGKGTSGRTRVATREWHRHTAGVTLSATTDDPTAQRAIGGPVSMRRCTPPRIDPPRTPAPPPASPHIPHLALPVPLGPYTRATPVHPSPTPQSRRVPLPRASLPRQPCPSPLPPTPCPSPGPPQHSRLPTLCPRCLAPPPPPPACRREGPSRRWASRTRQTRARRHPKGGGGGRREREWHEMGPGAAPVNWGEDEGETEGEGKGGGVGEGERGSKVRVRVKGG